MKGKKDSEQKNDRERTKMGREEREREKRERERKEREMRCREQNQWIMKLEKEKDNRRENWRKIEIE